MCFNRLMNFHVVRSTKPSRKIQVSFIGQDEFRMERDPRHITKHPEYPDCKFLLSYTQKFFFRNDLLRHLRIEQFTRYFYMAGATDFAPFTRENTQVEDPDLEDAEDGSHRSYDEYSANLHQDAHFAAAFKSVPGCKKRNPHRLGVSRLPFIECIGGSRESFYEMKLLLALPWFCPSLPETGEDGKQEWLFRADFNPDDLGGKEIEPVILKLGRAYPSIEMVCNELETRFCSHELDLICACCNEEVPNGPCPSCRYTVGLHRCNFAPHLRWRKGSLHAGVLDVQRVLFNLHRKQVPMEKMRERAKAYVDAGLITEDVAQRIISVILSERNYEEYLNDGSGAPEESNLSTKLTHEQMQTLLEERVALMQQGPDGEITDQFRVFEHIVHCIQGGMYLRLLIQASAGTGKSFLLTTVFLWCLVHRVKCKAAAPTGVTSC